MVVSWLKCLVVVVVVGGAEEDSFDCDEILIGADKKPPS